MTIHVSIHDGTNSGWRKVFADRRRPWTCGCGLRRPKTWVNCPSCRKRRP
jgi:hypothetical protein